MFRKLPILPWAAHLKKCINSQRMAATRTAEAQSKYQHVPLIVIIGATGCGKTKLSLELARRFNGEVISADSMQIYRGLDIATAKATAEEQAQVRHHLLSGGLVDLSNSSPYWTFNDWRWRPSTTSSPDRRCPSLWATPTTTSSRSSGTRCSAQQVDSDLPPPPPR